jgi:uncharacterized membrane protein YraQ (UPF0718 family)
MIEQILAIFKSSSITMMNLFPYVVTGVVVSEALKYIAWGNLLTRLATTAPFRTVLFSVALGIVSPMCTYGSLPIVLALLSMGFPVAALVPFLVASSMMNPQLFLITWGGISPAMALARLTAIIIFSSLFGLILLHTKTSWILNPNLKQNGHPDPRAHKLFVPGEFLKGSMHSLQFVGFYIILGVLLGSVVERLMPAEWLLDVFKKLRWMGILIVALMGVPLYACGGGTIPLIAVMLEKGMSPGAALAFFIVGPVTRVTPLIALATIIRPRLIALMIFVVILYAIGLGLLVDQYL